MAQASCYVPIESTQESPEAIEEIHDRPERESKETPKRLEINKTPG